MHFVEINNTPLLYALLFRKAPRLQQSIKEEAPVGPMLGLSTLIL